MVRKDRVLSEEGQRGWVGVPGEAEEASSGDGCLARKTLGLHQDLPEPCPGRTQASRLTRLRLLHDVVTAAKGWNEAFSGCLQPPVFILPASLGSSTAPSLPSPCPPASCFGHVPSEARWALLDAERRGQTCEHAPLQTCTDTCV